MRQNKMKRRFRRMSEPMQGILIFAGFVGVVGLVILAAILFPPSVSQERGDGAQQEEVFVRKSDPVVLSGFRSVGSLQRVTITDLPEGEAPLETRRAWMGITFLEARLLKGVYARGVATGELEGPADYWAVEVASALQLLRAKDPYAADWFAARVFPGQLLLFRVP